MKKSPHALGGKFANRRGTTPSSSEVLSFEAMAGVSSFCFELWRFESDIYRKRLHGKGLSPRARLDSFPSALLGSAHLK